MEPTLTSITITLQQRQTLIDVLYDQWNELAPPRQLTDLQRAYREDIVALIDLLEDV